MSFGAKGVYQGLKNGVTFQIKMKYVPFVTSCAHVVSWHVLIKMRYR
jgi:hypothetical protein